MSENARVSVIGLGAMGTAIADVFLAHGYSTTVWNRTAGKADALIARGARRADTVAEAVAASRPVIVCLLDYTSVHEVLDPIGDSLSGRTLVNLTTGTPSQGREMADWSRERDIDYVDGGMMATPPMIGKPGSLIFYSGSGQAFETERKSLELIGAARYLGDDAGLASLYDLALLSTMYAMFAGFYHGAALVGTEGVSATEFAELAGPWITAMTHSLPFAAEIVDKGDYATEVQSLDFNQAALDSIVQVSRDQGIGTEVVATIQALIHRQVAAGHGAESFVRIIEEIRRPAA